jgi:hypothetical protein
MKGGSQWGRQDHDITGIRQESGDNPQVTHVVFFDNAEAPDIEEKEHDKANRNITISVEVPRNAETGPIEVNLDGDAPFSTQQSFRAFGLQNRQKNLSK